MSYHAGGSGAIKVKGVSAQAVKEMLSAYLEKYSSTVTMEIEEDGENGVTIEYTRDNDDWDEDETFELFEILKPFTTEGLLYFEANDEDPWRYRFDSKTGEWAEDGGMLVYRLNDPENEDIQKELTRRGLL